jgi:hypothetical protein|tara:strand:+ start:4386 stop:4559 length:174 start_codon:yes stop_codon:yes gene_type:complete
MAYISEYGNWGNEEVLVLDDNALTSDQWQRVEDLPDNDKLNYAKAILAGADLDEWED